jgi:hypothetical protein
MKLRKQAAEETAALIDGDDKVMSNDEQSRVRAWLKSQGLRVER